MTARSLLAVLAASLWLACAAGPSPRPAAEGGPRAGPNPAELPAPAPEPWRRTPPPPALAVEEGRAPFHREVTLPNGLRVVAVEHRRRPVVVVRLVLPRGALSDPPGNAGATHLAVSLASDFHEITPWGEEIVDERPFRWQVVEAGGVASFEVGSDASVVGISGWAGDLKTWLDLLADAVVRPRRGAESFRHRRNALLDDLEDLEPSDPEALERVLAEAAFGVGHPYARSVRGTAASLGTLGLEDVVVQQERVLVPRGATLLVVGDVAADRALLAARAAFARWTAEPPAPVPAAAPGPPAAGRDGVGFLRRLPASTLVVCASRPLAGVREAQAAHDVLAALLGGTGGRLTEVLRERSGLTYVARAAVVRRRHARALLACSPIAADRAEVGIQLFREALEAVRAAPPGAEELERAKGVLLADREAAHDDAAGSAGAWVEAIAAGEARPRLEEERAEIARVGAEVVHRLARDVLRPEALRWIVSGEPRVAVQAVEANRLGRLRALVPER